MSYVKLYEKRQDDFGDNWYGLQYSKNHSAINFVYAYHPKFRIKDLTHNRYDYI